MANIIQTFPGGGSGGGHTIQDSTGTALAQEKNLKITGLSVSDNPSNESTDLAPTGLNSDSLDDIAGASLPSTVVMGNGFNYSTTEQIVGRWIDGKPLYQKTFTGTTPSADCSLQDLTSLNIDGVYSFEGSIYLSTLGWMPFGYSKTDYITGYYLLSSKTLEYRANTAYAHVPYYITLKYTKTTD